ncbi:MAG: hypothetical protein GKS01_14340 [Alphaproteobacteria bacterium]|nr:hypothetical protein [Alphaproteobacteria bacterium]
MLGFSLGKLIVLGLIIAAVWYGFKFVGRRNKGVGRKSVDPEVDQAAASDAQNMEKCAQCATFVPAAVAQNCGRDECPYPAAGAE